MGRPCVVGASSMSVSEATETATINSNGKKLVVKEGDWLSLDGSTGEVYLGSCKTNEPDPKSHYFAKFMTWAASTAAGSEGGPTAVFPRDAKQARQFGADGMGRCRPEHMSFAEDGIQ